MKPNLIHAALQCHREDARRRAAHVAVADTVKPVAQVDIPESLRSLPAHILATTPRDKLVLQSPHFECPAWAHAPAPGSTAHFEVHKNAERHSDLKINKHPYYLFGLSHKLCDFKFDHPSISRLHCAVVHHKSGAVFVIDLNSANGIKVNGTRIASAVPREVQDGDVVQLGASSRMLTLRLASPSGGSMASGGESGPTSCSDAVTEVTQPPRPQPSAERPTSPSEVTETAAATPACQAHPEAVDVAHILLKHKDVAKPVSSAPRNKGAPIARSKEDAIRIANALRARALAQPPVSMAVFTDLVEQFSECVSAKKGGRLPPIVRGQFVEPFESVAFALKEMHVSEPVVTDLGVHLILRLPSTSPSTA